MGIKNNLLKYGTFLLVLLAPLVFWHYGLFPHISSKTFFVYGLVEVLFFIWLYSIIVNSSFRLPKRTLVYFIPVVLFVLWMSVSGLLSGNPSLSFWSSLGRGTGLLTIYHTLALSFVVASLVKVNGVKYIYSLFQWFLTGAFVLALSVWLGSDGFRSVSNILVRDNGGGLSGNSTLSAGYLLFAIATGVFLLKVKEMSRTKKWFIGLTLFTILFSPVFFSLIRLFKEGVILGTARGTILALFAGILTTGLFYLYFSGKKILRNISIALFVAGIGIFSFLWISLTTQGSRINELFEKEARGSRFIFWDISSQAIAEKPVFGYGPENYFLAFQEKFNPQILLESNSFEGWADRAHNIYYDLGVSGGYPLILFYVLFILSLYYCIFVIYKKDIFSRGQVSILGGLLTAYIANNLFTFESTLSLMILFILSGILFALVGIDEKVGSRVLKNNNVRNIVALILSIIFVFAFINFVILPVKKSRLYAEVFSSNIAVRYQMYDNLIGGSPVGEHWDVSGLAFDIHKGFSSNPASIKQDKENLPLVVRDLEGLLSYLYKIEDNNTTNYRYYITIVFLENTLTYLTDREKTEELSNRVWSSLEKAKQLSPTNPNIYWVTAQLKAWDGDFEGIIGAYRDAIALDPYLPASHNLLINFAKVTNNIILYNDAVGDAKKYFPEYNFE